MYQKQGSQEKVIAYFSRFLDRTQRQYCAKRREILAIVETVISIRTCVGWSISSSQKVYYIVWWLQRIQQYNHSNADALSRRPYMKHHCKHRDRADGREDPSSTLEFSNDVTRP